MSKTRLNLVRIILNDFWRYKWILLLASVVMLNAILVVYTSYESRKFISESNRLLQEEDKLDIEWRNLLLEEQTQSDHSRVSRIAIKKLHMSRPLPSEEVIVRAP